MKGQQILGASGNQNTSVRDGSKLPSEESWSGFIWDISETLPATPSSRIKMKSLQSECTFASYSKTAWAFAVCAECSSEQRDSIF